jgi:uncharacterized protein YdaU (DUF1376 family)
MEIDLHYYQFNIGDYASHTRHLSIVEDLAYRRLLDLYYLHERPLIDCSATVARLVGLSDYQQEVETVLIEFFQHIDGGYVNPRADKEIAHYHAKIQQASNAGKASAERRYNSRSTTVQPNNNQEPITNNHKPNKKQKPLALRPDDVSQVVWDDFIAIREKVKKPFTATALKIMRREAEKAGFTIEKALETCCARGWQGFEAKWVQERLTASQERRNTMDALTRGLATPKPQKPFWSVTEALGVNDVEG